MQNDLWREPCGEKIENRGATGFDGKMEGLEERVEDSATSLNGGTTINVNNNNYALAA
jgi:hypothetical protein